MYILNWITRWLLPGAVGLALWFIPEVARDAKEWLSLLKGGINEMVDEKLRTKMAQLLENGCKHEALEISRIIDVQILNEMRDKLKKSIKSRIPTGSSSEYRVSQNI